MTADIAARADRERERQERRTSAARLQRLLSLPRCCADTARLNPRRGRCDQHAQWSYFVRDCRKAALGRLASSDSGLIAELSAAGFRVSADPDSWKAGYQRPGRESGEWLRDCGGNPDSRGAGEVVLCA